MKKILGTIAIAALLSSAVFADVKVGAEVYMKPTVMNLAADTKTEGAKPGVSFFTGDTTTYQDWSNSEIGVSASTDNVGITAKFGANLITGDLRVDNWYGWFTVAGFKTSIGNFTSRFSGGFLNKDIHDSNISFMPGNWSLGVRSSGVAADADNFTRNYATPTDRNRLAFVGDYTFKFGDEMLILAKAGLIGKPVVGRFGDASLGMDLGYAFEAAFQMPLLVVDALVRVMKANTVSTSAFVTVNPVKAMNLLVGATLGWEENSGYTDFGANGYAFEFGVDLGLRFALSDNMSITAQGNIGRIAPNMSADGRKEYNDLKKTAKDAGGDIWKNFQQYERESAPWQGGAVLNWTMGINDIFKIYAEGGFTGNGKLNTIKAQFGTVIKPVANATVVAAVRGSGAPENGKMTLDIPVSVKVAF